MIDLSSVPKEVSGVLSIDLDQLAENWKTLQDMVSPAQCASVVKANAYGLGVEHVTPALEAAGCRAFFVATLQEAQKVRTLSANATIYVLDGLLPGAAASLAQIRAVPVLASMEEIKEWSQHARTINQTLPTAIQIETGLNRLGLPASDVNLLANNADVLESLKTILIMTHLASADEPTNPKNDAQRKLLEDVQKILPTAAITSTAASDGLMLGAQFHQQLVRPGYALYGGQASMDTAAPVKPVVGAYARVLQVRDVAVGQTVGYNETYRAAKPRRIATLAVGYADGVPRTASASTNERGGCVAFAGKRAPIVGRVSMDLITVDISELTSNADIKRGDWAELIGPTISLEEAGTGANTIGYEILTNLSRRFLRIYQGGSCKGQASKSQQ